MSDERDPLADLKGSAAPQAQAPAKEQPKAKQAKLPAAKPVELPEEPKPAQRFVVKRKVTIPWHGGFITLHEGTVVSDADYGPGIMDRFTNMGVALEPA